MIHVANRLRMMMGSIQDRSNVAAAPKAGYAVELGSKPYMHTHAIQ